MRIFFLTLAVVIVTVVAVAGFRGNRFSKPPIEVFPDMDRQLKVKYQKPSDFFADGRAARMPVEGTVPQSVPVDNEYFLTGAMGDKWGDGIPVPVTPQLMKRGADRYAINCQPCHGATGSGKGIVPQYGSMAPANFHQDMFRLMPDGQIFNTITKGKATMMAYGSNITPDDRWAIIAYVRALQRSQNTPESEIPANERARLSNK